LFNLTSKKSNNLRKNNKSTRKKTKAIDLTNSPGISENDINNTRLRQSLKPRSSNQTDYIRTIAENTITFCQGLAGSGKTHIAIGMALEYLVADKVSRIIVTRPVIEAGERLGYLPGTAEEKLHPYLLPIIDEINHFINPAFYNSLKLNNKIEVVPLGLMRGRNFHDCFIVADECQNATYDQLKMLLTRIGRNSKMVLTGDIGQSDLHRNMQGGFLTMINNLNNLEGVGISELTSSDIVRHPIIVNILARLDSYERVQR